MNNSSINNSLVTKILIGFFIVFSLFLAYGYYLSYQIGRGTQMADQGLTLVYEGKYDEAEVLLRKALDTIPSYKKKSLSLIYKDLAFSFELQGKIDKAIENLEKAQHLFSDRESRYYSFMGHWQLYTREVDELIPNLEKAITLDPNNPDPYNIFGVLYMGQLINEVPADFEKALSYNKKAFELQHTPAMTENLATNYYMVGKLDEALKLYIILYDIREQRDPFSRSMIGMIYDKYSKDGKLEELNGQIKTEDLRNLLVASASSSGTTDLPINKAFDLSYSSLKPELSARAVELKSPASEEEIRKILEKLISG